MIKKFVQKLILSFFLLYWFNKIGINFNMIIPINICTIILVYLFDLPGLAMLILSLIVIF